MSRILYLFIFMLLWEQHLIFAIRQEGATIKFFNRKYVSQCTAFTGRRKRGEPYKTNVTFANLQSWANNVTFCAKYSLEATEIVLIRTAGCDIMKIDWLSNFIETFSNIPKRCPLDPGVHSLFNIELPPKDLPMPVPKGRYLIKFTLELTKTKEIVIDMHLILHT